MALDPQFVVIGGGLMDPRHHQLSASATSRSCAIRRAHLWPAQKAQLQIVPATLGDLSQAIGAALVALYEHKLADPRADAKAVV